MLARLLAWLRRGDGEGDGPIRDVTPDWQYSVAGRLHGGGDARAEQEDAVADVAEQAERL